jgi:hypothetical protein
MRKLRKNYLSADTEQTELMRQVYAEIMQAEVDC